MARKKSGDPRKQPRRHRAKSWLERGMEGRRNAMTHEEMLANPSFSQFGHLSVTAPKEDEVEVLKEVPAMHTGLPGGEHEGEKVQVGIAILHSDGTVGLRYDEDAPIWAMQEIQSYADKIGYSLGEGEFK